MVPSPCLQRVRRARNSAPATVSATHLQVCNSSPVHRRNESPRADISPHQSFHTGGHRRSHPRRSHAALRSHPHGCSNRSSVSPPDSPTDVPLRREPVFHFIVDKFFEVLQHPPIACV